MATKTIINNMVDAFTATVNSNLVALGLGGIEERAEDPAVMDKVRKYGSYAYIIPLAEGRDRMDNMQGGTKDMYHNLSVNITAYFDQTATVKSSKGLTSSLRLTRDRAYDLIDLFNGNDNQVGYGYIYRFELEMGYYEIIDFLITTYNVKFFIKILEVM
jgi:hypothetical protein